MAKFANGKIEAFTGPVELGELDNLENVIIDFINNAKHSITIAVQELDSEPIAQALIDARCRSVSVRIIMEQDYLSSDRPPTAALKRSETKAETVKKAQWYENRRPKTQMTNRDILCAFLRNAIDVKMDYFPRIFHPKFIIRDYRGRGQSTSAILVASTNFTHTGMHRNFNHIVIFHDYRLCRPYLLKFDEMRSGDFGAVDLRSSTIPAIYNLNHVPVRLLFSPDSRTELEIVKQMLQCHHLLDLSAFTLSDSSGISEALAILRSAGREIQVVLDPQHGKRDWASRIWLHREGIYTYFPRIKPGFGKLHHKLIVIDNDVVVGGSFNYTAPTEDTMDQDIFIIGSPSNLPKSKGGPVDHEECARIATYFRNAIDSIISKSELYEDPVSGKPT